MKKFLTAMMTAAASVMLFSGCGRSNEQIETDVKPLVEQIVGKLGVNATCTHVKDIRKDERVHYTASAEVKYRNALGLEKQENLDISIVYDKDQVSVKLGK